MTDEIRRLGPIRPHHATDGWEISLGGKPHILTKEVTGGVAEIHAPTPRTPEWRFRDRTGQVLYEGPADDVEAAKIEADIWLRERGHE